MGYPQWPGKTRNGYISDISFSEWNHSESSGSKKLVVTAILYLRSGLYRSQRFRERLPPAEVRNEFHCDPSSEFVVRNTFGFLSNGITRYFSFCHPADPLVESRLLVHLCLDTRWPIRVGYRTTSLASAIDIRIAGGYRIALEYMYHLCLGISSTRASVFFLLLRQRGRNRSWPVPGSCSVMPIIILHTGERRRNIYMHVMWWEICSTTVPGQVHVWG